MFLLINHFSTSNFISALSLNKVALTCNCVAFSKKHHQKSHFFRTKNSLFYYIKPTFFTPKHETAIAKDFKAKDFSHSAKIIFQY